MSRTTRSIAGKAVIAAAVAAGLFLTGCSGQSSPQQSAAPGPSFNPDAKEINLEIAWWGNADRQTLFQKVIDGFEAKYPKIHVTGTSYGAPDDLFNRLATDFGGGGTTAPDVFALGGAKPQEYGTAGALLDLDTVKDMVNIDKYPDFSLTSATVDKKLYGLPTGGNATAAFINTDIFQQAGVPVPADDWTWDDLVSAANKIGKAGLKTASGAPIMGIDLRIQDILGTYAGQETKYGVYDWDGNLAVGADTIEKWFKKELALQSGGGLPDATVVSTNWNLPTDQQPYALGQAGITFGYSNLLNGPYGLDGKTQILLPPTDTKQTGVALLPSAFWAVNAASAEPQAAALLMNYFLADPDASKLILDTRGVPFNTDTAKIVVPLLTGPSQTAAEYVQKTLDSGTVAPPQPNGGANMNQYSQNFEADVLFKRSSASDAAKAWVDKMTADLKAAQ